MRRKSQILMVVGALLPLFLFVFPLWNITLEAPQYPTPLGMDIYINDFVDAHPHDIKNINLMNHYVGMKYIPDAIPEFKIFPAGIIITTILGLVIGLKANYRWFLGWFILMVALSSAGLYDFYLWEHDYGHDLDPKAIMKFTNPDGTAMGFQPPLFGSKDILNFRANSYPKLGAFFLAMGMFFSFIAFFVGKKEYGKYLKTNKKMERSHLIGILIFASFFLACSTKPQEIEYGSDSCQYCKMTIVDKIHGAEIITRKGKVFKFDAIECMIKYSREIDTAIIAKYLSNYYENPQQLMDATKGAFLISESIPSPMGAYLTAFESKIRASKVQVEKGGEIYSWGELLNQLKQ